MKQIFKNLALLLAGVMISIEAFSQVTVHQFTPIVTDTEARIALTLSAPNGFRGEATATITACADGAVLFDGPIGNLSLKAAEQREVEFCVRDLRANLWTPATPHLYNLTVRIGESTASKRVGFRKFEMRDGRFYLNDQPIFLRGNAINPPNRGIPKALEESREFARDYVRFLKGMHINIIRTPTNQNWLDVCDEEGMMIFGGRYGRPRITKDERTVPTDIPAAVEYYKEQEFKPLAWHPSVVIYVMSNELPYAAALGQRWDNLLQACYEELIKWDHTRPYIGNAGYGLGRAADIYDVHRYWGWYYNSFLTYLHLRDKRLWQNEGKVQAITFTECVGNYTGVDGAYNICSRTKQPGSQKCWTGHIAAEDQSEAALEYQAFMLKQATEFFRRLRPQNNNLAGVMPFTILFHNWDTVESFAEMRPKPAAYQYGVSYQPILISWENWYHNAYAGNKIKVTAHVVNDDDHCRSLEGARLVWRLENMRKIPVAKGFLKLPTIAYYDTWSQRVSIELPEWLPTGNYRLVGEILRNEKCISTNTSDLYIAGAEWQAKEMPGSSVALYDPIGTTAAAFDKNKIAYTLTTAIPNAQKQPALIIGEEAWDQTLAANKEKLTAFVKQGGRILVMRQKADFDTSWLPCTVAMIDAIGHSNAYPPTNYAVRTGMHINIERPSHPIFAGIEQERLKLWSDYTDFRESQPGFPAVYPVTSGFSVRKADMARTAVLANYDRNLVSTALCEITDEQGVLLMCGFDLAGRSGIDPVADRLLRNTVQYLTAKHLEAPTLLVEAPIWWGDFTSERGIVTGANNGLILNTYPIVPTDQQKRRPMKVDELGYNYVGSYISWSSRPGIQYVGNGRRPFAPYNFSGGGTDRVAKNDTATGRGYFAARVPQECTKMMTLLSNPSSKNIEVTISINGGKKQSVALAPREERLIETPLPKERTLRVEFEGSRSCVLLMTEFK